MNNSNTRTTRWEVLPTVLVLFLLFVVGNVRAAFAQVQVPVAEDVERVRIIPGRKNVHIYLNTRKALSRDSIGFSENNYLGDTLNYLAEFKPGGGHFEPDQTELL